ncbi:hypothetical protein [Cellulophaga sp. BC115SP]|uniref:hypothetical protein n=1 Tax=Cellulophaga sp. BC115SP TaxID=2683263 RepID=UPI001411E639|nr:hypothetical protein [Cellulophaga sp. BC115SP]
MLFIVLTLTGFSKMRDDIPGSHERALNNLLKAYQKEINLLVPMVVADPSAKKAKDFVALFFSADTCSVVNHGIPANLKPEKKIESIVDKATFKASEMIKVYSSIYKKGFTYELNRDDLVIESLDSIIQKSPRLVFTYQVKVPLSLEGKLSNQLSSNVLDTLNFETVVYTDSKNNVKFVKINRITRAGERLPITINPGPTPTPTPKPKPEIVEEELVVDWSAEKKVKSFLALAKTLQNTASADSAYAKYELIHKELFSTSSFVKMIKKDGTTDELALDGFVNLLKGKKMNFDLVSSNFTYFDNFRKDSMGMMFCRATTYHNVSKFEKGAPISENQSTAERMPSKSKLNSKKPGYTLISQIIIKEL